MTERIIQRVLRRHFVNFDYVLFNSYLFSWESDFFAISKTGYTTEVEIKISKADFKKDFTKKEDKHKLLINHRLPAILRSYRAFNVYTGPNTVFNLETHKYRNGDSSHVDFTCPANHLPNKFYYCCPEGLLTIDDIPTYAGLFYVSDKYITEVKPAPFLHKIKKDHRHELLSKFYWKTINDRSDILQQLLVIDRDELTDFQRQAMEKIRKRLS